MSESCCGICYMFLSKKHTCDDCTIEKTFVKQMGTLLTDEIQKLGKSGDIDKLTHLVKHDKILKNFKDEYLEICPLPITGPNHNISSLFPNITKEGIIMLRHVSDKKSDLFWKHCYDCIRNFYPTSNVLIIDDNSKYEFITDKELDKNVIVIQSEYPGRGELLPYYYYSLPGNNFCETALCIHDSMFITRYIDIGDVKTCKMLWSFSNHHPYDIDNAHRILSCYKDKKLNNLFNSNQWKGCFGGMCIINHNYLLEINNQYKIKLMLNKVTKRAEREAFERVWGVIMQVCEKTSNFNNTLIGDIHNKTYWGTTWEQRNEYKRHPITKTWYSR